MNESYAEWLVKRKPPVYGVIVKAVMVVLSVISIVLALSTLPGMILMFLVCGGTYLVFRNLSVEYEYLYVTGQFSVDKILGRAKRKKTWETTIEEIQIVAPTDSYLIKDHEKQGMKVMDFSSGETGVKTYSMISQQKGQVVKVIFEPNDKMIQCMRQSFPRKIVV